MGFTKMNRKGIFFTLITILLIIPLIYFITFHISYSKERVNDVLGRTRCERLYYFVEDVRKDMMRAMVIFGRRAAIYAISDVVTSGEGLEGYEFNCSVNCEYDGCGSIEFRETGAEAALAELMVCGTLHGEIVPYMQNHTFPLWMDKMENAGEDTHFTMNLSLREIRVLPRDAWSFATISSLRMQIWDEGELCFYEDSSEVIQSNSSIIGLEDPLYPLNTEGRVSKYIINCSTEIDQDVVAGCSRTNLSNGIASGTVLFYSQISSATGTYCTDHGAEVDDKILVIDKGAGSCNTVEQKCFNASADHHFAGVVDYFNNDLNSFTNKCNITIPWVTNTCKKDNVTSHGPGGGCTRPPGCDDGNITTNQTCIVIKTVEGCGIHQVLIGFNSASINTSCYQVSDVNESYNMFCGGGGKPNAPSFFDRLDGRLYLSNNYKQQANRTFNNTLIGIESLISPYTLEEYSITPNDTYSWMDYLYWTNSGGCEALGVCEGEGYPFNLDCPHAYKYEVDTECANASGCCGDGTCNTDEDCGSCPADCPTCPEGCPNSLVAVNCSILTNPPDDYNVTYWLWVYNTTGGLINVSTSPQIDIDYGSEFVSGVMNNVSQGIYNYTIPDLVFKNDDVNATLKVAHTGCPVISTATKEAKPMDMAAC